MVEADRIDAQLAGDVHHLIERVQAFVRHRRVDADAQRRALPPPRVLQPPQPLARAIEGALEPAGEVVQLARAVDRDADVFEESRC